MKSIDTRNAALVPVSQQQALFLPPIVQVFKIEGVAQLCFGYLLAREALSLACAHGIFYEAHKVGRLNFNIVVPRPLHPLLSNAHSAPDLMAAPDLMDANSIVARMAPPQIQRPVSQDVDGKDSIVAKAIEVHKKAQAMLKNIGKNISESELRNAIESAGLKTFPRPTSIPPEFRVKISRKGGGMVYYDPKNVCTFARVMPGKIHSPNYGQQRAYVVQAKNSQILDLSGRPVQECELAAHIPLEIFIFWGAL
jgi:hypothetical protein